MGERPGARASTFLPHSITASRRSPRSRILSLWVSWDRRQESTAPLTLWGYGNGNHTSNTFRNGEIYQWNFGVQRQLPGDFLVEVNYSASHATHLPWNYSTENRNFVSRAESRGVRHGRTVRSGSQSVPVFVHASSRKAGADLQRTGLTLQLSDSSPNRSVAPLPAVPGSIQWIPGVCGEFGL